MTTSSSKTMQELHRIREQMTKEYQGLSTRAFVERTRREVEVLRKKWKLPIKQRLSPSHTATRS